MYKRWIPIDIKPQDEGSYLVWDNGVIQAHYIEERDIFVTLDGGWVIKPTHWMPALESPEEE